MTPEKLEQITALADKIQKLKTVVAGLHNKTRPDPRAKVIHPWKVLDTEPNLHNIGVQFKGGVSDAIESLNFPVPHRLMVNWVRDLENYYESELRILEEEFSRL